ncbi:MULTISPECIES: GNAT family N-acetyltransferase [unclassified Chryseobacterium]|uniref:GNAT family N-acetyltransferase n=1 Tax=unclassified Chryseobacterium TaxID=2593645 RepID=UPI001C1149BA|nr:MULTISPECIES: GNAT family N-acetyltransferase [unclassified Chryseobacterium]QWT84276.1 GNAT family N-acetyltransferase [Chryseobacterium sp. PCH239]WFB66591.1 GNAT family N-acetyltransferase [Chryseobacterium sp. WX]
MEFLPITSSEDPRVQEIYTSYSTTFPVDEQRDKDQFDSLFSNPYVELMSVIHESEAIGYLILWKLSSFVFVEHFEVFEAFRSKKLGSHIMNHLSDNYPQIILEIEPAELSEDASRRYSFYQRNNFSLIDTNHVQPSYGEGKKSLNLWLLANYTPENVEEAKKEIHKIIYA